MTKIKLILSFDYELPLGGCSSYSRGLFEPAEALISLAGRRNIKIVLFADILSAVVFRKWDYEGYYKPFAEQLGNALKSKHEVQLHLHPHWLDSKYENGKYFPSRRKILSKFIYEKYPLSIEGIIETGIKELNGICSVNGNYRCIAYRGAGYNLQPDTDVILTNLYKNGIRYDSSIIKGYYFKSDIQEADYRRMPEKANWIIPLEGPPDRIAETGIMEVPVASMPADMYFRVRRIIKKLLYKKHYDHLKYDNKGTGHVGKKTGLKGRLNSFIFAPVVLSFDHLHHDLPVLDSIIRHQFKIYRKEENIALCLNSHPKSMGPHHLELMAMFIDHIRSNYKDSVEFCGFEDL